MKRQEQVGLRNLIVFILVIFIGLLSIVAINRVFRSIHDRLDQSYQNKQIEMTVARYILSHIQSVESQFYKISLSRDYENGFQTMEGLENEINHLKTSIEILKKGGKISHHIELNLIEMPEYDEYLEYKPSEKINDNLEALDILPQVNIVLEDSYDLLQMIRSYQKAEKKNDQELLNVIDQEISELVEQESLHFMSMKKTAGGLIYEIKIQADAYNEEILSKKEMLDCIEFIVSISIVIAIILLGYFFGKHLIDINRTLGLYALEAEKANVAKTLFISNMSHEIRTPLNAIIGFSEVLNESQKLPAKEKEYSDIINRSANTLLGIVNNILDYSKIETNKLELEYISFKSEDLLEEIIEMYSLKASEKEIRLIYNPNVLMPRFLYGDPIRLRQVLINLLGNAIKFTDRGGRVELAVNISNMNQDYVDLEYVVLDNGIGIAPDSQKLIFKSFEQAEKGTMRKFGGTGLGLAISQKLVQSMGGQLHLVSQLHKGSRFSFTIKHKIDTESIREEESVNWNMTFGITTKKDQSAVLRDSVIYYLEDFGSVVSDVDRKNVPDIDMIFVFYTHDLIKDLKFIKENYHEVPIIYIGDVNRLNTEERHCINDIIYEPIYKSKILKILARYYKGDESVQSSKALKYIGNVLVAEDNLINQRLMDVLLSKYGVQATFVDNGEDAVKSYRETPYDLVFMDLRMPIMGGVEAAGIIREVEKTLDFHTTIIALTADVLRQADNDAFQGQFDEYMIKPIQIKHLEANLDRYLQAVDNKEVDILKEGVIIIGSQEDKQYSNHLVRSVTMEEEISREFVDLDIDYDVNRVIKEIGFTKDEFISLLDEFFHMLQEYIYGIQEGIKHKNKDKLKKSLHQLRGTTSNLRFKDMANKLSEYETYALDGDFNRIDVEGIEEYFERLYDHIGKQK